MVGPEGLSGEIGDTVLGRPDIDRGHEPDPAKALEATQELRPNLVVLDAPLEEVLRLTREIRDDAATRSTAIVWLNRADPPDVESELTAAGVNAVIPVPVDPFLWDRRLEELLSVPARRRSRIPARVRDWSKFVSGADEAEGTVLNIGSRGALLETTRELELGGKIGLRFDLPGESGEVAAVGQVVRVAPEEGGQRRVGVEFLIYRGDARDRIAAYVETEA